MLRAEAGDLDGARLDARDAVKHSHERGDRPMLTSALEAAVAVLQQRGHDEAAAVLAGALAAGVTTGVARSLNEGILGDLDVGDALDRVQAELGAQQYAAAASRGGELNLDDTVAYVLSVLDVVEAGAR